MNVIDFDVAPVFGLWLLWPALVVLAFLAERVITRRLDRE